VRRDDRTGRGRQARAFMAEVDTTGFIPHEKLDGDARGGAAR
jgi:signal recognition particle GTPase